MPQARPLEYCKIAQEGLAHKAMPPWLTFTVGDMSNQVGALSGRAEIEVTINEQLVVEFYSR